MNIEINWGDPPFIENIREFSDETRQKGAAIIGLQAGSSNVSINFYS